ncbi:MAG: SRPBCC family protein [Bacteroidetes bacterium]|nr:SRPBCC family protein [Bacteroidota bacterium]
MKIYTLEQKQFLPISLTRAWEFFSNPHNLKDITPPSMDFRVISETGYETYAGLIIQYTVKPMFGIPVRWTTEITHVRAPHFFVDEQRFGPYSFWHHQHLFQSVPGGVEMKDIVSYGLPFGPLGQLVRELIVKRQLEKIFGYRRGVLERRFPADPSGLY